MILRSNHPMSRIFVILLACLTTVSATVVPNTQASDTLSHSHFLLPTLLRHRAITPRVSRDPSVWPAIPANDIDAGRDVTGERIPSHVFRQADSSEDGVDADAFEDDDDDDDDFFEDDPEDDVDNMPTDPDPGENSVEINVQTGGATQGDEEFFKSDPDTTSSESKDETVEDKPSEEGGAKKDESADAPDVTVPSANTTDTTTDSDPADDTATDQAAEAPATENKDSDTGVAPQVDGESATDSSLAAPANETTAFSMFTLNVVGENDSEELQSDPIFEKGALVGILENCPATSDIVEGTGSACHVDRPYVDRLSFTFSYRAEMKDYTITEPTVTTSSGSSIRPEILKFEVTPESGSGSFTIMYHCVPGSGVNSTSSIGFHFKITADQSIDTSWTKECGHGRNELIEFGFISQADEFMSFNADGTYGSEDKNRLEVGPTDPSTILVMRVKPPALTQEFLDPVVTSSSSNTSVSLRETMSAGTAVSDVDTRFAVLYECLATGASDITFTVAIPPWDNVTTTWRKDCGGDHAAALLIGLDGSGSIDVMQDKELDPSFSANELTTMNEAYEKELYVVPWNKDDIIFYLTNSDDTSDIHIQSISTTLSSPDVVHSSVETRRVTFGSSYIPQSGTTLKRGETKRLLVHFTCKKAGAVVVLVTLPMLRYKNVEFGFVKECHAPVALQRSGFLQTANSLLGALFFVLVGGVIGSVVYMRKRRNIKYAPVSTEGR